MDAETPHDEDQPYDIRVACADAAAPTDAGVDIDCARIAAALRRVLALQDVTTAALSVAIVDDATMTDLHDRYMNIPEPTDVLTFDLSDEGDARRVDGEIVVCIDVAQREAAARGHALADELLLYAVHGCLHLLGYDDLTPEDSARMHAREDELLTELGIGPVYRSAAS
ncbi:MAG TPA: rRNA maturation RNase YbeY [Phycisphaerae bacterium]|nr:rRNA maturation RNase YbeY [Phycisphaerales bacterium]HRX87229.1 rRNA maturation RNase YbeY [Phycisphaerae bacterium]